MHFGLFLPPFEEFAEPQRVVELAQTAEERGWDGLFLWDHMLAEPGMAVADSWVTMAAVASATRTMRIGALVTPLARRRPWVLARQIVTLDRLSNGRLVVGVGLGDDGWGEFSSFGEQTDPKLRGEVLDEALELLQELMSGQPVHFAGQHFAVDAKPFLPRPMQEPIPIWAACRWPNRKPLVRAARLHGCFPIFPAPEPPPPPDPEDVRLLREQLADLGARPGFDLVIRYAVPPEKNDRAEARANLEAAGATWVLASFGPGQPVDMVEEIVQSGPSSYF
ncbi:MAG: LLM class flavin-dependent oxidoreductase [Mycobacteriales bacterium]